MTLLQVAKDRKEVFEQEEREKAEAQGCDNSIEGSEECHQEQQCGTHMCGAQTRDAKFTLTPHATHCANTQTPSQHVADACGA